MQQASKKTWKHDGRDLTSFIFAVFHSSSFIPHLSSFLAPSTRPPFLHHLSFIVSLAHNLCKQHAANKTLRPWTQRSITILRWKIANLTTKKNRKKKIEKENIYKEKLDTISIWLQCFYFVDLSIRIFRWRKSYYIIGSRLNFCTSASSNSCPSPTTTTPP